MANPTIPYYNMPLTNSNIASITSTGNTISGPIAISGPLTIGSSYIPVSPSSAIPKLSIEHTKEGLKVYLNRQELICVSNIQINSDAQYYSEVTLKMYVQLEHYTPPESILDVMKQASEDQK